ncbi:Cell surface protein [Acidisarcina polymorpha]|uniref:Cell surface protein n=1 Tax=Acidisarcina polymorpha TaxID=2211140 RepID=A0A2Z5FU63_9BACT|nr:Ig-like domain repeat protein [Acidisarcina polymorpha]AXC10399.1 Cell surface protein [Acidisarcina polymorpha]
MKTFLPIMFSLLAVSPISIYGQDAHTSSVTESQSHATSNLVSQVKAASPAIEASYGKLPLSFEANQGQSDPQVKFLSRGQGYSLFLTGDAAVLALTKGRPSQPKAAAMGAKPSMKTDAKVKTDVVRMELAGAARDIQVSGADPLPGKANYFIGSDSAKWDTDVPTYAKVKYRNVYPGIDLVYYGNQRQLEYDFVVSPNADPKQARLHFAGASKLKLNDGGDLEIIAKDGEIAFHKPVVYQVKDGQRQPVEGSFQLLANNTVGFRLGGYDHSRELVVDPVLAYSTYLGGSGGSDGYQVAIGSNNSAYFVGFAYSADFPLTGGAFQTVYSHSIAFVSKLNPAGTALLFSTFLGGADIFYAVVDGADNIYLSGIADSGGIPFPVTPGAFQPTCKTASTPCQSGFVTKLNAAGSGLIYSTYLGGSGLGEVGYATPDDILGLAVDPLGHAYVTGEAFSSDFPVTHNAYQKTLQCTAGDDFCSDGFVTELNAAGTGLAFSTYLGPDRTNPQEFAVDNAGSAYVAGFAGPNYPVTANAFQKSLPDGGVFITKLNPGGATLAYSTYLGGDSAFELLGGLAVDAEGNAYVAGLTNSANFPVTSNAYQKVNNALANLGGNAFITKLNPSGSSLVYSTYLGGSGQPDADKRYSCPGDGVLQIAVDTAGNAYIVGNACSANFPVTSDAFQKTEVGANPEGDGFPFFTKLNSDGSALLFSTYFNGANGIRPGYFGSVAADTLGNAYLGGSTWASDYPTTGGAFQQADPSPGHAVAVVTKLAFNGLTETKISSSANQEALGNEVTFTAHVVPVSGSGIPTGEISWKIDGAVVGHSDLDGNGEAVFSTSALSSGAHNVVAGYLGDPAAYSSSIGTFTETITGGRVATPIFPKLGGTYPTGETIEIVTLTPGATIYYTTNGITPSIASTKYTEPIHISATTTVKAIAAASGDTNSAVATATYTIKPGAIKTKTSLKSSINPSTAGNPVKFTATVTAASGSAPTGTVTFKKGSVVLGSAPLVNGVAAFSTSELIPGRNAIAAIYTGSATDAASAATLTQEVQ